VEVIGGVFGLYFKILTKKDAAKAVWKK